MKKTVLLIIFLLTIILNLKSNPRDSLIYLIKTHSIDDTVKVNMLLDLSYLYWYDIDTMFLYASKALSLSEHLSYVPGIVVSKNICCRKYAINGSLDTALINSNEILELSLSENYEKGIILAYSSYLVTYYYSGDFGKAVYYYNKFKSECNETKDLYLLYSIELYGGMSFLKSGDTLKAKEIIYNIDPRKINDNAKQSILLSFQSQAFMFSFNDYDSYNKNYDQILKILREIDDKEAEIVILSWVGSTFNMYRNYSKVLENTYRVLDLSNELNDSLNKADALWRLCWTYYSIKDYEKAKLYGNQALDLYKLKKKIWLEANTLYNLGLIYTEQDSLGKARSYFLQSLELCNSNNLKFIKGLNYSGLMHLEDLNQSFDEAEIYLNYATEYYYLFGTNDLARAYPKVANHYFSVNDIKKALLYADSAYYYALNNGADELTLQASEILFKIYSSQGEIDSAYKYLLQYKQLNEKLNRNAAKELGLIYEFEQENIKKELEQEKKDLLKEKEIKEQRKVKNIFVTGFGIIFILSVVIFRNLRQQHKANELLKDQKNEISVINEELFQQKQEIEEIHQHISDSINYATRIQSSILPNENILKDLLTDHFVFFKPKDKVSGDFYWWSHIEDHTVITAADCTGHGVPGAFMSMLGVSFLREIVNKEYITHPGVILRRLRKEVVTALRQKGTETGSQDGMDMALISINHETGKMQFSGANNPIYLIRKNKLVHENEKIVQFDLKGKENGHYFYEVKPDRMPISIYLKMDKFTTHEINLQKGDSIYLFSDGYADQFGGPNERKFKYKQFKQLLFENVNKSMSEQKNILEKAFIEWKGDVEQIDDIVILGIKI